MIWWYGGALQGGSVSGFDGSSLAANGDVIVLASNYRVGVFGFPGNVSGIPADELNAGFRDQKRALQWIQDNIASFGGDKNRVTIFGDSAGAVSVDSQLLSEPFDKPLFHSAILHSGGLHTFNRIALDIGPYSTGLGTGNKKDEAPFLTLAKALGCPADQALQCVQSKTMAEVKAGVSKVNLLFPPVDDDGLSSVDDSDSARRAGRMVKVPTMVGSTFSEGDIFPENLISSKSVEEWIKIIYPRSESKQKAVLDAYAIGTSSMIQTTSQARRLLHSDYQFACTSTYDADIMASVGIREFPGPPVLLVFDGQLTECVATWRFMFNASLPNGKLASHGSDVGFLFGTSQATETNLRLSRKMQAAWGAFAKNPAVGPGWAKYGSSKASVANIGGEGSRDSITMIDPIVVDLRCPVFTDVYDPNRPAPGSRSG